tara:strand:- start:27 stop:743 length:717 start_codon:yes stop_codon:yes gene_type:complete
MQTQFKNIIFLLFFFCSFSQSKRSAENLYPNKNINIKYHDDWGKNNYNKMINEFKKSPLNFGDVVFLGNSITQGGGDWSERLNYSNISNRGIGGDVTDGVLARLEEITFFKPKAVFLLIGINDLWNVSPEIPSEDYIGKNIVRIAKIIKERSNETKVFIQTVLPIEKKIFAEKIKNINTIIKNNHDQSTYDIIDLHSVFVNDQGTIKKDLTSDGVHLNERGYQIWVNFIRPNFRNLFK